MKQEDKELLLKDLSARLPYGVKGILCGDSTWELERIWAKKGYESVVFAGDYYGLDCFKPYLFPLSSMTEEQIKEYYEVIRPAIEDSLDERQEWRHLQELSPTEKECPITLKDMRCDIVSVNWMLERHFDINGLIEKGLAIDATGLDIYKEETK